MPSNESPIQRSPAALPCTITLVASLLSSAVWGQENCPITQVTSSPTYGSVVDDISSNGRWLTLHSQADLTGGNSDHNLEVFRHDLNTGAFLQITDTVGVTNNSSEITDDGNRIAFRSTSSGSVFVHDVTAGATQEVIAVDAGVSSMSGDGERFSFLYGGDLTGQNPDSNIEVFLYLQTENRFIQISDSVGPPCMPPGICPANYRPRISTDGSAIVFASDFDLAGVTGPNVYLFDVASETLEAIAPIILAAGFPTVISGDGQRISYLSTDGLVVFDRPTGSIWTPTPISFPQAQALDHRGRRLVFHNGVFDAAVLTFDPDTGAEMQLTPDDSDLFFTSISGNGALIATSAFADWTGENPDGSLEAFVLRCAPTSVSPLPIPTLHPIALMILVLFLAGGGVLMLRRRV